MPTLRTALREQSPSLALQRAAADEIARLDALVKELQSDAARYRWLRKEWQDVAGPAAYAPWGGGVLFEDELDKALDAAMSAYPGAGG